jgi:small subunit ribosomal protein S16
MLMAARTDQENRPVAVKIKLMRLGKIRAPHYRVVVADSRTARNGRAIEEIGKYQPIQEPSLIEINSERAQYWLSVGAQPTDAVLALLKVTGDWQKFKGLPGAEGTLKFAPAKVDKRTAFEAALKQANEEPFVPATTPKKKAAPVEAEAPAAEVAVEAEAPVADEAPAAEAATEVAPEAAADAPTQE